GALVIAVRHSADGAFRNADNGGKDHNAQKDGGGQHILAAGSAEQVLYQRHNHHQAEEAVHDGGNARQQVHRWLQKLVQGSGTDVRHIDGGQRSQRNPRNNSSGGDVNAADNHGEDAVVVGVRPPVGTQQKLKGADFGNGRQAVCEQIDANQHHGQD